MGEDQEKIIIFTGAGASAPLKYPVTNDFFNGENSGMLEKFKKKLGKTTVDVEEVLFLIDPILSFFETPSGSFFKTNSQHVTVFLNELTHYKSTIKDKCFQLYGRNESKNFSEEVLSLYKPLFNLVEEFKCKIDFFTTNYDPVVDEIIHFLDNEGKSLTDGFNKISRWEPNLFESDYDYKFYRLHGSMSYQRENGHIINTGIYRKGQNINDHCLIYPGYKGNPRKENKESIYVKPQEKFEQSLSSSKISIFIGFAFRDETINEIIIKHNKTNIAVVNYEEEKSFRKRMPEKFPEFTYLQGKFGDETTLNNLADFLERFKYFSEYKSEVRKESLDKI